MPQQESQVPGNNYDAAPPEALTTEQHAVAASPVLSLTKPANDYEERRQDRIDRLREHAARRRAEGSATLARATAMADVIPFGQPILVGHHSEGRDRRYRRRIASGFARGYSALGEADELERRAEAAENNQAISSDDPEADTKLGDRVAELRAKQELYRNINQTIRSAFTRARRQGLDDAHRKAFAVAALADAKLVSPELAPKLVEPDFAGRIGIADYAFRNNAGNIRRLEERRKILAARKATAGRQKTIGDVRIVEGDRVRIIFPDKPSEAVRSELKAHGFRWSPTAGAWQRHPSASAWWHAERIAALATAVCHEPSDLVQ